MVFGMLLFAAEVFLQRLYSASAISIGENEVDVPFT